MQVVPYADKYKKDFVKMNTEWISKMFVMEPEDFKVLNNIEAKIADGGQIFFALDDEGEVLACSMIAPLSNKEWEIEKFCAKGMYTGTGAGSACLKACIDYAKEKQVEKIVFIKKGRRLKPRPLGRRSSRGEAQFLIRCFLPVNILTDNRYRSTCAG